MWNKMYLKKLLFGIGICGFALLIVSTVLVGTTAGHSISGYVSDMDSGTMIANAKVNTSGDYSYTNGLGCYQIDGLGDGTYNVHAYRSGYRTNDISVTISGGDKTNQNITLDSYYYHKATTPVSTLDDTGYGMLWEGFSEKNWTKTVTALAYPYVAVMGNTFFFFIFAAPYLMAWIKQGRMIIPMVWGFIIGGIMLAFLPFEYKVPAIFLLIFSGMVVIVKLYKER